MSRLIGGRTGARLVSHETTLCPPVRRHFIHTLDITLRAICRHAVETTTLLKIMWKLAGSLN